MITLRYIFIFAISPLYEGLPEALFSSAHGTYDVVLSLSTLTPPPRLRLIIRFKDPKKHLLVLSWVRALNIIRKRMLKCLDSTHTQCNMTLLMRQGLVFTVLEDTLGTLFLVQNKY